jgi:hypothetical protein
MKMSELGLVEYFSMAEALGIIATMFIVLYFSRKQTQAHETRPIANATVVDGAIMFVSFRNDDIKEIESKEYKNLIM